MSAPFSDDTRYAILSAFKQDDAKIERPESEWKLSAQKMFLRQDFPNDRRRSQNDTFGEDCEYMKQFKESTQN